ncbi:MAG: HEAT repeat domain-containing protein [Myxococcales bacterium]|nr:HEAT repeat domain-containing protein [Myxococcales bacterium]
MQYRKLERRLPAMFGLAIALTLALSSPLAAKPPKARKTAKAKAPSAQVVTAAKLMASSKREDVEAGIQSLGLLGTAEATPPLTERIRAGLPPDLLQTAILTLVALGQKEAGPVLLELSSHRRAAVRVQAIEAIASLNPDGAEAALSAALSDSDAKVRAAAANALGTIGAKGALPRLFTALDGGNMEASGAIGKLIDGTEVSRLMAYLGKTPFQVLASALGETLQRPDVDVSVKLQIVARMEEVGTREVKAFLGDLMGVAGDALGQKVSRAILRAMQEIPD